MPLPCLIQTAHIIKGLQSAARRSDLARQILESLELSVDGRGPWVLTPAPNDELLNQFRGAWQEFADEHNDFELVDCFVALEADRLKRKFSGLHYSVHIWTKDHALKAREPDAEPNPFVG